MQSIPIAQRVLGQLIEERARRHAGRTFFRFEDRTISYAEFDALSNRLANGLMAIGVRKGMHVALLIDNRPEIILLYAALGKIGAVSVPVNTAAKGELLAYYLTQSDSEMVLADIGLLDRLAPVLGKVPKMTHVIGVPDRDAPYVRHAGIDVAQSDYQALLEAPPTPVESDVRFTDLHSLVYTSGTTGPSKGNMSTHAHTVTCGHDLARAYGYREDDVLYVCLPLFHGNAWLCSVMPALIAGASVAVARRFSASGFWQDIRRFGATQFNALGAMTNFIWSRPPEPTDRDHSVRQVMVVPTPQFFEGFEKRFGIEFTSVYALTDCGMVTARGPDDPKEKWASAGKACPDVEIRIVDDDDFEVPTGQPGEIVVRTDQPWMFAQGYYNMPDATANSRRNLWFHTGDRGYLDADGYLYFVDRKKDAIRRRGENISSFEVERIIVSHPAVLEVAAYPVRSEHSEDEVMVSVVRREDCALDEKELIAHCAENMAYFMVPRYVEFVPALPKTMTEKVEKYRLKAAAEARLPHVWDREKHGIVVKR